MVDDRKTGNAWDSERSYIHNEFDMYRVATKSVDALTKTTSLKKPERSEE